jgi:hypothetical protein
MTTMWGSYLDKKLWMIDHFVSCSLAGKEFCNMYVDGVGPTPALQYPFPGSLKKVHIVS